MVLPTWPVTSQKTRRKMCVDRPPASPLAAVDALLERAGTDKSRILMVQIFLADLADVSAMNEVWEWWIAAGNAPPRATIQASLAEPEWRIEIVVTAALQSHGFLLNRTRRQLLLAGSSRAKNR